MTLNDLVRGLTVECNYNRKSFSENFLSKEHIGHRCDNNL